MEYLSDGITENIINTLSQLPKLRVVARSTVFRYKDRQEDPLEVGRLLGVQAVMTGRVRQIADCLIISTELIDVAGDSQLWGEHFNRNLSDIFAVQEEIEKEITDKLRLRLSRKEKGRLAKRHPVDVEAYQSYLKGRFFWNKRTTRWLWKGVEYFQQAIDRDPGYALAYAGLADSYTLLVTWEALTPGDGFSKAKAAARKALEIDSALAEGSCRTCAHTASYVGVVAVGKRVQTGHRSQPRLCPGSPMVFGISRGGGIIRQIRGRDNARTGSGSALNQC